MRCFGKRVPFHFRASPAAVRISATEVDFPDLLPDDSDRTRSFSMEFSRALLQHAMHASWGYEHLTEDYLMLIDVDISPDNMITNGGRNDGSYEAVTPLMVNGSSIARGKRSEQSIIAMFPTARILTVSGHRPESRIRDIRGRKMTDTICTSSMAAIWFPWP